MVTKAIIGGYVYDGSSTLAIAAHFVDTTNGQDVSPVNVDLDVTGVVDALALRAITIAAVLQSAKGLSYAISSEDIIFPWDIN